MGIRVLSQFIPVSVLLNFLGRNALHQQIRDEEHHPDFIQTRLFLGSAVSFEIYDLGMTYFDITCIIVLLRTVSTC